VTVEALAWEPVVRKPDGPDGLERFEKYLQPTVDRFDPTALLCGRHHLAKGARVRRNRADRPMAHLSTLLPHLTDLKAYGS
jgi:hypothetical protein